MHRYFETKASARVRRVGYYALGGVLSGMERKPPIYLWESGQFKGLRNRIFLLIFQHCPIVNLIFIGWARNLLKKKIGRLWGSAMGKFGVVENICHS